MATRSLFVTRLYEAPLGGPASLNAELEEACRMLEAEDRAGHAWAKAHAYKGYTSYASLDDLPRRATAFAELKKRLDRHAAAFAQAWPARSSASSMRQASSSSALSDAGPPRGAS